MPQSLQVSRMIPGVTHRSAPAVEQGLSHEVWFEVPVFYQIKPIVTSLQLWALIKRS